MPVRPLSSREFVRLLEQHGCLFVRQRGTSHAVFVRETSDRKYAAPVQMGKSSLSPIYIKVVLKEFGFLKDEIQTMFE